MTTLRFFEGYDGNEIKQNDVLYTVRITGKNFDDNYSIIFRLNIDLKMFSLSVCHFDYLVLRFT